jgi:hypothetical protein
MHEAVIVAAALGCAAGAIQRGSDRVAWSALGVGLLATAVGDLI